MPIVVWNNTQAITPHSYVCGYCGEKIASNIGYHGQATADAGPAAGLPTFIYVCPYCGEPTYFEAGHARQWPGSAFGGAVEAVPPTVHELYEEARRCMSVSAYTTAAMACRKLLMNLAVDRGAKRDQSFKYYVDWLVENHFVPPGGDGWADQIRGTGNEATHEIKLVEQHAAERVLSFVELLLRFVYEFPARAGIPPPAA